MKLAEKLKQTIDELEAARIKGLEAQHNANLEKIRAERLDIQDWLKHITEKMTAQILAGKVPLHKVSDYSRQEWIRNAMMAKAKHQDLWQDYMRDWAKEGLSPVIHECHDGMGMESWINMSVKILPKNPRGM